MIPPKYCVLCCKYISQSNFSRHRQTVHVYCETCSKCVTRNRHNCSHILKPVLDEPSTLTRVFLPFYANSDVVKCLKLYQDNLKEKELPKLLSRAEISIMNYIQESDPSLKCEFCSLSSVLPVFRCSDHEPKSDDEVGSLVDSAIVKFLSRQNIVEDQEGYFLFTSDFIKRLRAACVEHYYTFHNASYKC